MMDFNRYMPEQVFHYCPKCGADQFVPLLPKKFQCRRCQFTFYFNACGATAAIIRNEAGEILLTTRAKDPAKGMLDLPGGFLDFQESAEDALHREVKEELAIEIDDLRYIFSIPNRYVYADVLYRTIDLFFECRARQLQKIQLSDEIAAYQFTALHDIDLDSIGLLSVKKGIALLKEQERG